MKKNKMLECDKITEQDTVPGVSRCLWFCYEGLLSYHFFWIWSSCLTPAKTIVSMSLVSSENITHRHENLEEFIKSTAVTSC